MHTILLGLKIAKNKTKKNAAKRKLTTCLGYIIIIIKRISRAPIYCTRWEHRALYNNTNNTHRRARACTHSRVGRGVGTTVKNSLEIIIKLVRLEGGFKRGGRLKVAEFFMQIVPNRWASIRKRSFTKYFRVYTKVKRVRVSDADRNCLVGV